MTTVFLRTSHNPQKRLDAIFTEENGDQFVVPFGQRGGSTFLDHHDPQKQDNYLKRHFVQENWKNPYSAGALSRYILWNKKTLRASLIDYGNRFGIKPIL